MPFIQPQNIPVSFTGGLNSKNDELQMQPPGLLRLQNAVFDKIGRLNKRFGYDLISKNITDGGVITQAFAVDSFQKELNLFDNNNLYTYISGNDNWTNRGTAISLINTNKQIIRLSSAQQLNPDMAYLNGFEMYVWEDSRGGVRYSVLDTNTNSYPVSDRPIVSSVNKPKVVAFNGLFYVFYANNNNLYYRTVDPDNPFVVTNQVAVTADCFLDFVYDVHVNDNNNRLYVAFFKDSGSAPDDYVSLFYLNSSNTKVAVGDYDGGGAILDNSFTSISVTTDSLNQAWVCYSTGTSVKYLIASSTGSTVLGPTLVDTVVAPAITGIESFSAGALYLFYEINAAETTNQQVQVTSLSASGVATPITTSRAVGLASKPFINDSKLFINLIHESPLQSTYFTMALINDSLKVVGKINAKVGGTLTSNGLIPQTATQEDGVFLFPNLVKGSFISENNTNFTLLGVNSTKIDFTNVNKFNSITQTNQLLFVGGILQSYDGASVNEHGFQIYPEGIESTVFNTGGALSVGQYQYRAVYAWSDKFGQVHYSEPSEAVTVSSVSVTTSVLLTIPTLRLTNKENVVIKVYRTQVNSVVLQEVTSELVPLENDPTVDTVQFLDVVADVQMASNSPIYTTGGVLPNTAPPSCSLIAIYQDRVMLAGLESPNEIWFSKNKVNASNFNTIPVEFSATNTVSMTQVDGPITGIATMDDKLIIFKRGSIYLLQGQGPNDTGGDAPFPPVQIISNSVGCDNPNSIVLTKNGLFFQSVKGIWLLDRGLGEPVYIGAGVDQEARDFQVSSATVDPNDNLIIFTTFNGPAIVYEYLINQWMTWTSHNSVDSVAFQNKFVMVKSNGQVFQQNRTKYTDGTEFIPMEIITPWFSFGQMQGYQSIFRVYILGQFKGPHNLNVSVGYDFNTVFSDGYSIPASTISGSNLWGSSDTWGDDDEWGGTWTPYQFQVNMQRQKCMSIRLKIVDSQEVPFNEGYTISSLSFQVGVMGGHNRIPKRQKVGVV